MTFESPAAAPDDVRSSTAHAPQPVLEEPVRKQAGVVVATIIGFVVAGIAFLVVAAYFALALGPTATLVGALLALVPLGIVLFGVVWIDRWEPEPRTALVFAFLWGATVSILVALFVDAGVQDAIAAVGGPNEVTEFLQLAVQAPVVEEIGKGLGVLLIFLVARHLVDGPIDGIVYGAVVAGGFAFTENIQYFGLELSGFYGDQSDVASVFFLRGILSPFAHVLFTMCTGLAIGLAARRGSRLLALGAFLVGLLPAILLHAFWNGSTFFIDFFVTYVLVQVPLFVLAIVFVVVLQRQEVRITGQRLAEYAAAGWIAPAEVPHLATAAGRRQAIAWARSRGMTRAMRRYIRDATQLAFARQRMLSGRDLDGNRADEAALLMRITASRRVLAGQPEVRG